jgi:hypothetical protein
LVSIKTQLDKRHALPVLQATIAQCKELKITQPILALISSTVKLVAQRLFCALTVNTVRRLLQHLKLCLLIALLDITVLLVFRPFATQDTYARKVQHHLTLQMVQLAHFAIKVTTVWKAQ